MAENAGGGRAVKYGVTGQYIHGLEVVTPTGEIIQLGGKRIKDVTGYDMIHLMVGSEGTLPELLKEIYIMTAGLGGTISGEHGIGHKRRDFLSLVMSEAQLDMMRKIKIALDPNNILNPGKVINLA